MRHHPHSAFHCPAGRGLTLVEAIVSILIVGMMLASALTALGTWAKGSRTQSARCLGAHLARQLMGEVLSSRYREPDAAAAFGPESPESAATRADWDDVDDYHAWSASPPQAKDGTPLTHAAGWRRQVTVEYVRVADPATTTGSDEGLQRITVTVTSPDGRQSVLRALRGASSLYDELPETQTTYVSQVGLELQLGPDEAARVASGTHVLNRVPAGP